MSGTAKKLARRKPTKALRELSVPPRCGAIEGGDRAWLRKRRPDGTEYSLPITVGGTRCPRPSAVSSSSGGKSIHRCPRHLNT